MKQNAMKVDIASQTTYGTFFLAGGTPAAEKGILTSALSAVVSNLPNSPNRPSTERIPSPPKRQNVFGK